jgi:drug/metabolite transporter (DMT)-like permease
VFIGDALFAIAGIMWASAAVLVKRWRIPPLPATASVAVLSAAFYLPLYAIVGAPRHLADLPVAVLAYHAIVGGMLAGIVAVLAFTRSVELLGPARAAITTGLVPVFGVLAGVPLTGEMPTLLQLAGLGLATLGALMAIKQAAPTRKSQKIGRAA